jgi:predicted ester cyclase
MRKTFSGLVAAAFLAIGCNSKTNIDTAGTDSAAIKTEKNKQTALASVHAFEKADMAAIKKFCAANFVDYGNGGNTPLTNIDSVKTYLETFRASFPDARVDDLKAFASGDTVVITDTWSGTFKNDMMGMKANGKKFKYPDVEILVFNKDGKILSHRAVQSDFAFYGQLGIAPPAQK